MSMASQPDANVIGDTAVVFCPECRRQFKRADCECVGCDYGFVYCPDCDKHISQMDVSDEPRRDKPQLQTTMFNEENSDG